MTKKTKTIREGKIAKEIIDLKFKNSTTFLQARKMFFNIMRKHGIKQGTPVFKKGKMIGVRTANPEWTLYHSLFTSMVGTHFMFENIFSIPEDIKY